MAVSEHDYRQLSPWQKSVAGLLTLMFGIDGRELTTQAVVSWAEVLHDEKRLTPDDCYRAIKDHYRSETRRMWPADLIIRARRLRADRKRDDRPALEPVNASPMPDHVRQQIRYLAHHKTT